MNRPTRHTAGAMVAAVGMVVVMAACTRHIDQAQPQPGPLAAPITTLQVADLLSAGSAGGEGNLFVTAGPPECSGLGQEVNPPFIDMHRPLATDGGHWTTPDGAVFVEEMVAVFRFDFDPARALDNVRRTLESCRDTPLTVTTMSERTYVFDVEPAGAEAPPSSVLWTLRAVDWVCDNSFVAAHNAAIEITACGAAGGFDSAALAEAARKRIETLANTTA